MNCFSAEGGASTTQYVLVTVHPHSARTLVLWNRQWVGEEGWVGLEEWNTSQCSEGRTAPAGMVRGPGMGHWTGLKRVCCHSSSSPGHI